MKYEGTILVPLAPGFEEIEAVTIIDVLRRAGLKVQVAGLKKGAIEGSHGISVGTDCELSAVDPASLGMIVLPGGMPGSTNLMEDERILRLVRELAGSGRRVAAICAAPTVLARAGILEGKRVTCYPGFESKLGGALPMSERIVREGTVLTSQGPGTALEFALAIVEDLCGAAQARELGRAMIAR